MKKGFTLIELLAVIVILAIIALIATPIILGIINDARRESNERSVELYASAVRNAVAAYQLTNPNAPAKFSDLNVQYDGEVVCSTQELYSDGSFYITECTVNGTEVDYAYGRKKYEPQYYGDWDLEGTVSETSAPSNPSKVPPIGKNFYLGYDVDSNNKISTTYVCFIKNANEYCLKSAADGSAYASNIDIIKDAYSDVVDTDACYFEIYEEENEDETYSNYGCRADGLYASTDSIGLVIVDDGDVYCSDDGGGNFSCHEY